MLKEALALGTTWRTKAHFNPRRVEAFGRSKCTLERTPTRHGNPQTSAGLKAVTRDLQGAACLRFTMSRRIHLNQVFNVQVSNQAQFLDDEKSFI